MQQSIFYYPQNFMESSEKTLRKKKCFTFMSIRLIMQLTLAMLQNECGHQLLYGNMCFFTACLWSIKESVTCEMKRMERSREREKDEGTCVYARSSLRQRIPCSFISHQAWLTPGFTLTALTHTHTHTHTHINVCTCTRMLNLLPI